MDKNTNLPYSQQAYYQAHVIVKKWDQESNLPLIRDIAIAIDTYYLAGFEHGKKIDPQEAKSIDPRTTENS